MNQPPLSQPAHPDDRPEPDTPDTPQSAPSDERADEHAPTSYESLDREMSAPHQASADESADATTPEEEHEPEEKKEAAPPPASRPPAMPPPLPTFGGPQSPPRFAAPPQRPPAPAGQPATQPPTEQPPYPPRIASPQPAPPGGMTEPPRPYEGGRYVPPPPIPPTGPPVPGRDWAPANTTIAPQPQPTPQQVAPRGNALTTPLLGIIAVLLLALAVFQGINTFHPKAAGVQQVQVQKQPLKTATAAEIKDTIDKAQSALNQLNQNVQTAYSGATTDAQRQAVLLQSMLFMEQIIAQQNNDLLLIYQDLNT